MILCDFDFTTKKLIIETLVNKTVDENNATNVTEIITVIEKYVDAAIAPSILQYVLSFWIFTLFCEELRQVGLFSIKFLFFALN